MLVSHSQFIIAFLTLLDIDFQLVKEVHIVKGSLKCFQWYLDTLIKVIIK